MGLPVVSTPAWLWIAGGIAAIAGVQTWRLHDEQADNALLVAQVATDRAARATAYAADSEKTAVKESTHAASTQKASDAFTTTQPARDDALRADLDRARRLLGSAEGRAARYRAEADAGAAACSRVADRAGALDRQLAEGLGVVAALRGDLERRDAEIVLLSEIIDSDRRLFGVSEVD